VFFLLINLSSIIALLGVPKENVNLFSLRHSKRAKRLIFKPSVRNGFEIVLPRLYDANWVLETLAKNKTRIERSVSEIREARIGLKPASIALPPTGRSWEVIYREVHENESSSIMETSTTLEVPERLRDPFWAPMSLQAWLHEKAEAYLPKRLESVAASLQTSYNKVSIKKLKSRWGSCSIKRNISLNRNLMLMSVEVVDYVLHHELVHLKVLNHSSRFWKELERSLPNYKKSLNQLKYFETNKIPEWALV
jgi:predicted metal-dependent hydrolase